MTSDKVTLIRASTLIDSLASLSRFGAIEPGSRRQDPLQKKIRDAQFDELAAQFHKAAAFYGTQAGWKRMLRFGALEARYGQPGRRILLCEPGRHPGFAHYGGTRFRFETHATGDSQVHHYHYDSGSDVESDRPWLAQSVQFLDQGVVPLVNATLLLRGARCLAGVAKTCRINAKAGLPEVGSRLVKAVQLTKASVDWDRYSSVTREVETRYVVDGRRLFSSENASLMKPQFWKAREASQVHRVRLWEEWDQGQVLALQREILFRWNPQSPETNFIRLRIAGDAMEFWRLKPELARLWDFARL